MNASNSSTSAQGGTSARIRSMAWEVFSCARVSSRKAVCSASIAALSKPRRARPMLLAPNTPTSRLVAGQRDTASRPA